MAKPQLIQELESKAGITYVDNQDKMLVNRNLGDGIGYSDGRQLTGDDLLPKYYFKTHRLNGLCVQLFEGNQIGLPPSLYHVITTSPWHDFTGGVKQIAMSADVYVRNSNGGDTWMEWRRVTTADKTFGVSTWLPVGTNANTLWQTGYYTCAGFEGLPDGQQDKQGMIITYNYNGNSEIFWARQIFLSPHDGRIYERNAGNGVWGEWRRFVTNYIMTSVSFQNGWTAPSGRNKICRVGNIVNFFLEIEGGTGTEGTVIATVPTQLVPTFDVPLTGIVSDSTSATVQLAVMRNGTIIIRGGTGQNWTGKRILINGCYPIY